MKTLPVVALIGPTNAGKSALFNRLTRSRTAIVAFDEGTTRDSVLQEVRGQDGAGGDGFWPFLKSMVTEGLCGSCQDGQSGNPACEVRICARGKGIEMCALCNDYPCEKFDDFFKLYPTLKQDNELLREQGMDAWLKLQEERRAAGGTCLDGK